MRIKLKTIKAFIKKRKKLLCILALVCVVLAVCGRILLHQIDKSKCEDIVSITLVYRYSNYAWGNTDYLYIMREDGAVFYLDLEKYWEQHDESDTTLLDDILLVLQDDVNISYQSEELSSAIKDALYSIDYDGLSLKYELHAYDAESIDYYALVQRQSGESELVKLKEEGALLSKPRFMSSRFRERLEKICGCIRGKLPPKDNSTSGGYKSLDATKNFADYISL